MHCKSYSHFFSKKFQHICVSLDLNFNESLTTSLALNNWALIDKDPDTALSHSLAWLGTVHNPFGLADESICLCKLCRARWFWKRINIFGTMFAFLITKGTIFFPFQKGTKIILIGLSPLKVHQFPFTVLKSFGRCVPTFLQGTMLSMVDKKCAADDNLKYFSYLFFQKNWLWHFMQIRRQFEWNVRASFLEKFIYIY